MTAAQEFARAIETAQEGYDKLRLLSDNESALVLIDALETHHVAMIETLRGIERAMNPEPVASPGHSLRVV